MVTSFRIRALPELVTDETRFVKNDFADGDAVRGERSDDERTDGTVVGHGTPPWIEPSQEGEVSKSLPLNLQNQLQLVLLVSAYSAEQS